MIAERVSEAATMPPLSVAERFREEMVAWDAMLKSAFRMPPYNPDPFLPVHGGYELYDQMMTDAMVRAAINTKRFALLSKPWSVFAAADSVTGKPSGRALEVRDFVESSLRDIRGADGIVKDFRQILFGVMSAFFRGFSLAELVWRLEEAGQWRGKFRLAAVKAKHPRQIGFEVDDYLNVGAIVNLTPLSGRIEVPREKCLLYVYHPQEESPYGNSDLRSVYKHWWSKDSLVKFWNLHLQRFGTPMVFAQVTGDGSQILETLQQMQSDASAVFPRDVTPQILQATTAGSEGFLNAVDWHNQQIAQGILLQTLTSGEGRRVGSLALGQVHFNILLYSLENAKQDLEVAINTQLIRPLVDYNFDAARDENLYPSFSLGNVNERDLPQLAQAYDVLLKHGVVSGREASVRELFDLPPMEEEGR